MFDGELSAADMARVRDHLSECDDCRDFEAGICMVSTRLYEFDVDEPGESLTNRVLASIEEADVEPIDSRPWLELFRPVPAGVAAACFFFGMTFAWLNINGAESGSVVADSQNGEVIAVEDDATLEHQYLSAAMTSPLESSVWELVAMGEE